MLIAQRASECLPALPVVAVAAVVVVAAVERTGESGTGTETAVPSAQSPPEIPDDDDVRLVCQCTIVVCMRKSRLMAFYIICRLMLLFRRR